MDIENNPYEVRLGWQVDLNKSDFIGKDALARIKEEGVKQRLVGLKVGGEPITWYNEDFYLVKDVDAGHDVGLRHQRLLVPERRVEHCPCGDASHALEARHPRQCAAAHGRYR